MNRTASNPLGVFFFFFSLSLFKKKKETFFKKKNYLITWRALILASYTWKVVVIMLPNCWSFLCRNYGCAQLWGFDCVSMKYVIHTLNVTSMTAHKPNDFFKSPKFRTLFSRKLHFSNPAENCSEICFHCSKGIWARQWETCLKAFLQEQICWRNKVRTNCNCHMLRNWKNRS